MRAYYLINYLCLSGALMLIAPIAHSQTMPDLKAALNAAWLRSPQAQMLEARRAETAAGLDAASSWLAGSPVIGIAQRSDRWTDRNRVRETELSVSAPLWMPGQITVRRTQAKAGSDDLEAQIAVARLAMAGEVREKVWAVVAAREALAEAEMHQQHLDATVSDVTRRVKAGDLARADGLLAQQDALAAARDVIAAQEKLHESLSAYRLLTGLQEIPAAEPEPVAAAILDPHPRMLAANAALRHAQASLDVVNRSRNEPPTIGLAMRREVDGLASAPATSVALAVQIPIGTSARNRPLETAMRTQLVQAGAEAAQAQAALHADIETARRQLDASRRLLDASSARVALAREHAALIAKAFRLGERGLADQLSAHALLHDAEAGERQQRAAVGLAHARLNQALGIIP